MSDEIDRATDETRSFLAARPAPDLTAAVMKQIENLQPLPAPRRKSIIQRAWTLLWSPREVAIRPVLAFAAAAAVLILLGIPYVGSSVTTRQAGAAESPMFVQFRLDAAASRVQLAGSFTNWEPRYELRQSRPGVWTITVPLTEGVHDYAFVVDGGQWVPDPHAPQIGDGFGGTNSRLALLSPETPQL